MPFTNANLSFLLSKEFLIEEYINKRKSKAKIARELKCSNNIIKNKLKEFSLTRELRGKVGYHNIKRIEDNGFKILGEYKGCHASLEVECPFCKNPFIAYANHLVYGRTQSCGCQKRKVGNNGYQSISGKQFSTFVYNARHRKPYELLFDISAKDIWNQYLKQDKKCIYTKIPLFWDYGDIRGNASLDRIDSSIGYTITNIQITHKYINFMKQEYSHDFFVYLCTLIAHNSSFDSSKFLESETQTLKIIHQYD